MKTLAAIVGLTLLAVVWAWPEWATVADPADFWTRQTARVAVLYWGLACALRLHAGPTALARWLWSLASAAYLIHVATAFVQVHHLSHAKAFQHVEETSGFGPGIFVSYGFTLLWMVDVLLWWVRPTAYRQRGKAMNYALHGFMAFIVFNGTVVYESGVIRWMGVLLFGSLGLLWASKRSPSP